MFSIILLCLVTFFYAAYNLLIKQSSLHAQELATTTVTATIALQLAATITSVTFLLILRQSGVQQFLLPAPAYGWAIAAGVCIGAAEIAYFYVFTGVAGSWPVPVSLAVPVIVGGSVVLATLAAWIVFGESLHIRHWVGSALVVCGVALLAWR
ncbi:hypothetical protein AB833_21020 [Chromatiales bacterium (ex Bugula neritina AB1)]|nr:hypothetical protein AB833_21020 [Chromatiales bacterium (ex Bugula neritina AB1)]